MTSAHLPERSFHNTNLMVPLSCLKPPKGSLAVARKPGAWTWLSHSSSESMALPPFSPLHQPLLAQVHACVRTAQGPPPGSTASSAPVLDSCVLYTTLPTLGMAGCLPACLPRQAAPSNLHISACQDLNSAHILALDEQKCGPRQDKLLRAQIFFLLFSTV